MLKDNVVYLTGLVLVLESEDMQHSKSSSHGSISLECIVSVRYKDRLKIFYRLR